ncbi:Spx/MgsR family RNA polymerase-binding regulatory protein [Niallia sp. Krafla_26]|uniref:Spx/MgsR family RNA polymerase-binding regulatory protein n=1 Tax=Niallia sp. Krafla_26 TaxID=3064703 RepID=UPI003D17DE8D
MTITIMTKTSCLSSIKAKNWFKKNNIPYLERNMTKEPLTINELQSILHMTLEGTDEILSTRSKGYKELAMKIKIDELPLKDLLELIHGHKELLKSPIILDKKRIMVGYNQDEIRQFIPRETRQTQWFHWKIHHLQLAE